MSLLLNNLQQGGEGKKVCSSAVTTLSQSSRRSRTALCSARARTLVPARPWTHERGLLQQPRLQRAVRVAAALWPVRGGNDVPREP